MIVCDRFVFIHLHKSGGTFVNQLLLQCLPSARQIGYHLPHRELPAHLRWMPVVGTVRNPWDYYVSWFFFQSGQPRPNPLYRICSDEGALDFSRTVSNLARLASDTARFDALRRALPDTFLGAGLNLTKSCLDGLRGNDVGFYSFLHDRMYEGANDLTIVPAENLRAGIRTTLEHFGALPNPRIDMFLDQAPRMNVSRHGHYRDYYDPELRGLIGQAEATVITKYGYEY